LISTLARGAPGPYQIQAAISALHCEAADFASTNWAEIALLYAKLNALQPSPVVRLNGAVALSFANGPEAGLAALRKRTKSMIVRDHFAPVEHLLAPVIKQRGAIQR